MTGPRSGRIFLGLTWRCSLCLLYLLGLTCGVSLLLLRNGRVKEQVSQLDIKTRSGKASRLEIFSWPRSYNQPAHVFAVVAVTSPGHNFQRRQWQRFQWSRSLQLLRNASGDNNPEYVYKFCIGTQGMGAENMRAVKTELGHSGDIQLLDSPDFDQMFWGDIGALGKSATTMKVLAAVHWAVREYTFDYLIRVGDDTYFRPEKFFARVQEGLIPTSSACIGYLTPHPMVYETPAGSVTVPYPSGMGFALTSDVAHWISRASDMLLLGGPEDGIVGTWFAGTKISIHHLPSAFRDLDWNCTHGEDILVHCLRDQAAWDLINEKGDLPCG